MKGRARIGICFSLLIAIAVLMTGCGGDFEEQAITPEQVAKLVTPDTMPGWGFGYSVSIDGDYAIIGAESMAGGTDILLPEVGAAYIFHRTGPNSWDKGTKIIAPDARAWDHFGVSVSISGDYAIVGSNQADLGLGTDSPMYNAGAAYIFHRTGTNSWDKGTKIIAPDAQAGDWFGTSVSICGGYAMVGAIYEDGGEGDPLSSAGAAYFFQRIKEVTWTSGWRIVAYDRQANDQFGCSVSMSDDYVIVGARGKDGGEDNALSGAGAAYIFLGIESAFEDRGTKITASDAQAGDYFGCSVSIDGDYVIVGRKVRTGGRAIL